MMNNINDLIDLLNTKIDELEIYGMKRAEAERVYKVAQAKFLAEQLLANTKVTILSDLAKGQPEIANLRYERDRYQILYEATQEAIYGIKLQIRISETNMKLDYGRIN